jgi:hypothetical protein
LVALKIKWMALTTPGSTLPCRFLNIAGVGSVLKLRLQ